MSYTSQSILEMNKRSASIAAENKRFLEKLGKKRPKQLDAVIHELHFEEFDKIDCLECANCCKSLGPMLFESDIERMASKLKMKSPAFKDQYIKSDEDGDNIFNQSPCPFLAADNTCFIYGSHPKACREYPHTDRKRFYQVTKKTFYNASYCPAVFNIVNRLKRKFPM